MTIDGRRIAVALAGFCSFVNLYATQSILPLLSEELGAAESDVSLTVSATTFAISLIAPFAGTVADVLGRKRVITAAMFLLTVPTVLVAFAGSLHGIVLWRFVQGLLLPPVFAVTIAYVGEEFSPAEATAVTGIYLSASSLGGFLGRFLTGLLSEVVGWRGAFICLALLTLSCAVGVSLLLPRERAFVKSSGIATSARHMMRHLADPKLVATYAVGATVLFTFIATFTYVSFHLAAPPFALSPSGLGAIFIVYLTGVVTTLFTGRGVARFGRRGLVLGLATLWAGGLALTLAPSLPVIILGLALCAGCGFVCQAVATGFVALRAKEGRSSAVGLYVTFYYVGGSIGGVLPGVVWRVAGWPGSVALVLGALVLMALIVEIAWRNETTPGASAR
jgi:MFS transporter, YNFM family, putative membrane transport protein